MARFAINKRWVELDVPPDTPLLWVIRDQLRMTGTKFGCGAGLCGACTVTVGDDAVFACQTEISEVEGKYVTTVEGLSADNSHPLQKAWIAEQVPQCGYCQSGQLMRAAALLKKTPQPTRAEIVEHMKTNLCRCGTYNRIIAAVERASRGS
ncbi:MAG TPA: (2Fe-2S)-binding protein [Stellaceae bacterium]|nr:(2Fe-2S)-binding protein [Stellaceae bacterium]